MLDLTLGYSPCPNDTFIFDALVHGRVAVEGVRFRERLEDVETLNQLAREAELDVTKISYGAIPYLLDDYVLLRSGGALGRGCGPLVVAREPVPMAELRGKRIAIPGRYTTANLLLRLFDPALAEGVETVYSDVMPAVERGDFDAGLIIHESRFTYPEHGLVCLVDLGEWWERETGLPIPLGGILARRGLGAGTVRAVEEGIRRSVDHAFAHPDDSLPYLRAHAQEMEESVMRRHVELYVNEFSRDLGDEGERAILALFERGRAAGIIPAAGEQPLFAP